MRVLPGARVHPRWRRAGRGSGRGPWWGAPGRMFVDCSYAIQPLRQGLVSVRTHHRFTWHVPPEPGSSASHLDCLDKVATSGYLCSVRSVGIKVLKNRLSEYVRLAASGETVLVTDRDKVVAELVPPRSGRAEELHDAVLADAVRRGWLTPALVPPGTVPPR